MIIRKARITDFAECVAISDIPEFSTKVDKEYLKGFLEKGILIVAEENKRLVGFIAGEFMLGDFVWVDAITVKKEFRGKGIGKRLFGRFKEELAKRGIKHTYLMAPKFNKNTLAFYRSLGMKEGKEFVEFSEDL